MTPHDIENTAFNSNYLQLYYVVPAMGVFSVTATFQTLESRILHYRVDNFVMIYIEDILTFSNTLESS